MHTVLLKLPGGQSERVGVHDERQTVNAAHNPVLGQIGLPDQWPGPKVVAEQGRSGLEDAFDTVLTGRRPAYTGVLQDNSGHRYGVTRQITAKRGADLRTTVDHAWQAAAQSALVRAHVQDGAVVVLDVQTSDVLAIASTNPNPVIATAVRDQTPGSVFKLVTLSAALESYRYRLTSVFHCFGRVQHSGVQMHCWAVHGTQTLAQALAQSCDVAFADVGMAIGRRAELRMATRLRLLTPGLQTVHGSLVLPQAENGVVFVHRGNDAGLLANTAIGQEDVQISPLAAANVAAALARGGVVRDARLVKDAESDGRVVRVYHTDLGERAVSAATAAQIRYAMRLAVTMPTGTAHWLFSSPAHPAVKTGTAELPGRAVNAWVTGFAPSEHPKIAFCVLVAQTPSARGHAQARQITQDVLSSYTQFFPSSVIG